MRRNAWKPVILVALGLACWPCLLVTLLNCDRVPQTHLADEIPLGSQVDRIWALLGHPDVRDAWPAEVKEWRKIADMVGPQHEEVTRVAGFGSFVRQSERHLITWEPSSEEKAQFTGQITVYFHPGHFGDMPVIDFLFVDGVLVKKTWWQIAA